MDPVFSLVLKGLLIVGTVFGVFFGHRYFKIKQDNPVEELVEKVVEEETGVDVGSMEKELEKDVPVSPTPDDKK